MTNISLKISSLSPWVGIRNISDYSPFGVLLPERTVEWKFYRNGFQGYEGDSEIKGDGNSYDYGARAYDSRVGRFLSKDPYSNLIAFDSPYMFSGNSPLIFIDLDGKFKIVVSEEAKMEKGSAIQIARFEAIVKDLENYLIQNPLVLNEIVEQTGLTKEEVLKAAKFGEGPTIYITINNNGAQATLESFNKLESGFEIDYTLIESLENDMSSDPLTRAKLNLVFGELVLHEFTHWGDRKTNNGNITGQSDGLKNDDGSMYCGEQGVCSSQIFDHRGLDVDFKAFGVRLQTKVDFFLVGVSC